MKKENTGDHLTKRFRMYDKENRIYFYASNESVLQNMIQAVEQNSTLNGATKKIEESQELKTTEDGKDE
ncbi:MAG: hypothetical protein WDZ47_01010 [Bacteroidales bacterium]